MSEDEAFIRAVVDNPGDDTPRLVYADWLDDRDDPRGPYLRAEREAVEAVETGEVANLHERAAGLDPVWVARVSRPPVGVCVEEGVIRDSGAPLTSADLDRVERRFDVTFPADYRAFLLNYNMGCYQRVLGVVGEEVIYDDDAYIFYPLDPDYEYPRNNLEVYIENHRNWVQTLRSDGEVPITDFGRRTLLSYIPVVEAPEGEMRLGVRAPEIGRVVTGDFLYELSQSGIGDWPPATAESFAEYTATAASFAEYLSHLWNSGAVPRTTPPPTQRNEGDIPF